MNIQAGRDYVLMEARLPQLKQLNPNLAVLPWGAVEAHGHHLPHGTDVIEANEVAIGAAALAVDAGARPVVLPAIPLGNDEQQLDQVATLSISTQTAFAILGDIVRSLKKQGIDRLLIVNGHGGNEFKPLIRDLSAQFGCFIVLANLFQIIPYDYDSRVQIKGDHADEMETSLMLHLRPGWVDMKSAGEGTRIPFGLKSLGTPGVWTPRPWSRSHPDTGSGDPKWATAAKGKIHFQSICKSISRIMIEMSAASVSDPFGQP